MQSSEQERRLFLQAARRNARGACITGCRMVPTCVDLTRGMANHPEWVALEWARSSNASPEVLRLLTPQEWPSNLPGPFCPWAELDIYLHVLSKPTRKYARQLRQQERGHHLFLRAAESVCKVCVQAWLDRGVDKSRGPSCDPFAFRWAQEVRADEELCFAHRGRPTSSGRVHRQLTAWTRRPRTSSQVCLLCHQAEKVENCKERGFGCSGSQILFEVLVAC